MVSLSDETLTTARQTSAPFLRPGGIYATGEGLRLQTIVRLRWLAVVGQALAVLFVAIVLNFPFPLGWCLAVIALSAWLNMFLTLRWRTSVRLHERYSALLLAYDIVQLAALLFLTGGLLNPFAFLFIVPVAVSAATLPPNRTLWLGGLALVLAAILAFFRLPLPWYGGATFELPTLYMAGVWLAIACCVVFSALYSGRTASESRQMSNALAATEMILAREQKLSALDGLAAAAAHELGTPLATIQLVAHELKRGIPDEERLAEDLDLLVSQSARCRDILSRLSNREAQMDQVFARQKLSEMLEEIVEPLRGSDVAILFDLKARFRRRRIRYSRADPHPQSRHPVWPDQSCGECRGLRHHPRRDRGGLVIDHGDAGNPRRRKGIRTGCDGPAGRSIRDDAAARRNHAGARPA